MDHTIQRVKDVEFDLESGGNTSEEDSSNDFFVDERELKSGFRSACNGVPNFDGSDKGKVGIASCSNSAKSDDVVVDENNLELLVGKDLGHVQLQQQLSHVNGNHAKQKTKPTDPRKPPKPPLPPKGPSLDASDQKFVKELAELALRKRARIKKMKAVRKMKANKSSTSSSSTTYTNLSAMVITVFFFLVIILQGVRSASTAAVGLMASPEAAVAIDEGLISVQYPKDFNTNEADAPGSHYPSFCWKDDAEILKIPSLSTDLICNVNKKRSYAYGLFCLNRLNMQYEEVNNHMNAYHLGRLVLALLEAKSYCEFVTSKELLIRAFRKGRRCDETCMNGKRLKPIWHPLTVENRDC